MVKELMAKDDPMGVMVIVWGGCKNDGSMNDDWDSLICEWLG